jgi:hypothetical protein
MKARPFTEEEDIQAIYNANIKLLKTAVELKEAISRESEVQVQVNEVRQKLDNQKEARRRASLAESEASKKLRKLHKELEEARELANSLSDNNSTPTAWRDHSAPVDDRRFDKPAIYHVTDVKSKGKWVDTGRMNLHTTSNKLQKPGPGKHQVSQAPAQNQKTYSTFSSIKGLSFSGVKQRNMRECAKRVWLPNLQREGRSSRPKACTVNDEHKRKLIGTTLRWLVDSRWRSSESSCSNKSCCAQLIKGSSA